MIIDAHNHPDWWGKDHDQMIRDMDAYRIDKTWILSWECPANEYDPNDNCVLNENAGHNGGLAIPVPVAWPTSGGVLNGLFWALRPTRAIHRQLTVWKRRLICIIFVSVVRSNFE